MNELRSKIIEEMSYFKYDSAAAVASNKAAGARSRKQTLSLEKLFKQWRKESVAATRKQD